MAQRPRYNHNRRPHPAGGGARRETIVNTIRKTIEPRAAIVYGDPFVLLEDAARNTFLYDSGAWIAYEFSIAELRRDCQVKQLAQQVNGKTRYEIRRPV
jgi:hypothetical protein